MPAQSKSAAVQRNADPNPTRLVTRNGRQTVLYEPRSKVNRKAFEWIAHWLKIHHSQILAVQGILQLSEFATDTKKQSLEKQRQSDAFNLTYQFFNKLPLY